MLRCEFVPGGSLNDDLEVAWCQFSDRLRAFIRRRVPDDDTAADLLQDVFIRVHSHLATLRDRGKLESWIYQIARHAIIDWYRAHRPAAVLPEAAALRSTAPQAVPENPVDEPGAETTLALSLRELVDTLPEPYREALVLTLYEGLTQQEMASRLGISLSGAKSRVQRARQKIRDALLTCCHFEFDRRGTIIDYYEHCCCCAAA